MEGVFDAEKSYQEYSSRSQTIEKKYDQESVGYLVFDRLLYFIPNDVLFVL